MTVFMKNYKLLEGSGKRMNRGSHRQVFSLVFALCAVTFGSVEAAQGSVLFNDDFESYDTTDGLKPEWCIQRTTSDQAVVDVVQKGGSSGQPNRALRVMDVSTESNPVAALELDDAAKEPVVVRFDWMVPVFQDQGPSVLIGDGGLGGSGIGLQLHVSRNPQDGFRPWIGAYDGGETRFLIPLSPGEWYHFDIELPRAGMTVDHVDLAITKDGEQPNIFHGVALRHNDVALEQISFLNYAPPEKNGNILIDNVVIEARDSAGSSLPVSEPLHIPNGSFEVGQGPWSTSDFYGPGIVSRRSDDSRAGAYSLEVLRLDAESSGWLDSPPLSWPRDQSVRIRFWMRGAPEVAGKRVQLELTGYAWSGQVRQSWPLTVTGEWKEYVVTARPLPKHTDDLRLRWRLPAGGWLRIDGVVVGDETEMTDQPVVALEWASGMPLVYSDEAAVLRVRVGPLEGNELPRVEGSMTDDSGTTVKLPNAEWTLDNGVAEALIDFGQRTAGLYEVSLTIFDDQGNILHSGQPRFASIHRPHEPSNWLAMFVARSIEETARALEKLGIGTVRFGAAEAWHVNSGNKEGQWKQFQGVKQAIESHDIKTLAVLQGAPRHLRLNSEEGNKLGRWARTLGLLWDQKLREEWKAYVRQIARNDAGYCGYESWNESNAASYFLGSTATFVDMLVANREALTEAGISDEHPVLGPTTSTIPLVYIRNVLSQVPPGTVDGVSIHPYRSGRGSPEDTGYPQELDELNAILHDVGMPDGQVWATESGWIGYTSPLQQRSDKALGVPSVHPEGPTESEAANYIIRGFVIGLTRGLDKQFYFLWEDTHGDRPEAFLGLCLNDGMSSPKLPLLSVSGLMARLNGAEFERAIFEQSPCYAYQFKRGDMKQIVAWTAHGRQSVRVECSSADATRWDRFGRPLDWQEEITLSEEPIFLECPVDAELTLTPVVELPQSPVVLRQDQPVKISLALENIDPATIRELASAPEGTGLWPISIQSWQVSDNDLELVLSPARQDASGYGFGELIIETAQGPRYVCLPVKFTSYGPEDSPRDIPLTSDWEIASTDQMASLEILDDEAWVSVGSKEHFFEQKWVGVTVPLPDPDISGFNAIEFEIETLEPTRDLAMGIALVTEDGTRYNSWVEPDVLASASGWQRVRIPLSSFRPSGLFNKYDKPQKPALSEVSAISIFVTGSYPQAQADYGLRKVRLIPSVTENVVE